jgi:hypothetical protein
LLNVTYSIGLTENGWTSDITGNEWLIKSFIPQVRAREPNMDEPILLILDGHGSHETDTFIDTALESNIHILKLPAHTTHQTQPLDVGCFGPLKSQWVEHCEAHLELTGEPLPKADFVKAYIAIRDEAVTPELVQAAFRKTGIAPFNANIFTEADYGPSYGSSTSAHLPQSFPGGDDVDMHDMLELESNSEDEDGDEDDSDTEMMDGREHWAGEIMDWEVTGNDQLQGIDNFGAWPSLF